MAKARDPFDVPLQDDQRKALASWLCQAVQDGIDARATAENEVDYWHQLYEQARTRSGRNAPWPDAADLTSYLASEKVDSLLARLMRTIWSDPVWSVEGWGDAANRAPFVEEFHQWKAEEERLQSVLVRFCQIALIEPRGLLEIAEGTETRTVRKTVNAKVKTDPLTGGIYYNEENEPDAEIGPDGKFLEAKEGEIASVKVVDETQKVRTGPVYRILPYRDSVILPGHARDKEDIWAYGKRFWRRFGLIQEAAEAGIYDKEAVERITATSDKESEAALNRAHQAVTTQTDAQAEKELWEVLVLCDLNKLLREHHDTPIRDKAYDGERWYLVTLHLGSQQLLRIQHDDMERSRFVPLILFPRPDRATEGFSFIGHKLITTIEEHTAWRNMAADRAAMQVQAPIKRLISALWDPLEQPWGPKAVIDVRDMREVEPIVVPDLTPAVMTHIQMMEKTADRVSGLNDIAAGQMSTEDRTLGEAQMATSASEVRTELLTKQFQEALEDIGSIRHEIWKRALAENQEGIPAPTSLTANLEGRGVAIDQYLPDGKITAELLEGAFRFKPRGSVQNADPMKNRQDFIQGIQAIPPLAQIFPMMMPFFQTPQAARAMFREWARVFNVENKQAFLGSPSQDLMQQQMLGMLPMPGALPGMGMPPPGMGMAPGMGALPGLPPQGPPGLPQPPQGPPQQQPQGPPNV